MERSLHFIRVGKSQSLKLELRVLPVKGQTSWFTCEHQHEVVNLLRGVIEAKLEALRVRGKALDKVTAQQDPDVITGATVRVACCFKKNEVNHTFLVDTRNLDNDAVHSTDISSEEEDTHNNGGSYRSFKVEDVRVVACVCQYSSEDPQTLPMEKLVQGLSQIPQRETTDISNYFNRDPKESTTSLSDGPEVPTTEKNRTNLQKMMKRGKLLKKNSKRKNYQIPKDTVSSSHISDSDSLDQNVPGTAGNGVETQTEDTTCDEVEKNPNDTVKEEKMSVWSEDIPSYGVPAKIKMIVREGTSEEITNAVAKSCEESSTFQISQDSQVGDTLPGDLPKKKTRRPKKNRAAAPSINKDGDVKMHKMRTNDSNSVDSETKDCHKDEATCKGVDTMILHQGNIDMAYGLTNRGYTKHGMLETQCTEDHKNVLGNDCLESHVQDSKDVEINSSHFSTGSHQRSFLDILHDARENKHVDADTSDRSTKISTSTGPSSLDNNNGQSSDPRSQFRYESEESSLISGFKTSETRTKRRLDSPMNKPPSKWSKLSRKKARNAVRKNCFDTYLSSQDAYNECSSQENVVNDEEKKQKCRKKQTCGTVALPTPSSTETEDYDTVNEGKMDSESCSVENQNQTGYSETQHASKNSVVINRNLSKRSSKQPSSQEGEAPRRVEKIHKKIKKLQEIYDDDEIELLSFSQPDLDANSSLVSADSEDAIADENVVMSKSHQKPSTHKVSPLKQNLSPVVKLVDIAQAEQFRRLLSPGREKAKESTSSQGSANSKKEVVESRSQDSHRSKQRAAVQVMKKRIGFRRQRLKVFDLDSAETLEDEDHNRSDFKGRTRESRSAVFDQDLDSCPNVSEEYAESSQDIEAKEGSDTNWTSQNNNEASQREKASVNSFKEGMDENGVVVNNEMPTQSISPSTSKSKRAVTMKKAGRGKKSKVVFEPESKDNRPSKRSSKAVSRPSQEARRGNKRQGICKTRVSKKTKIRDDPDSGPDILDEENTTDLDMQSGNSTIEEAMDVPEDEMNEMFFDMDDPGAVDDWQTTEIQDSIKNIRHVKDLNSEQIRYLIQKHDRYLKDIFKGKLFCRRHEDYKRGGVYRADLNFQVRLGMFHESQQDEVLDVLNAMYCPAGNNKYLDYVFKVLLPEALIKIHMDITGTSHDESEDIMQQALSRRSLCASMCMSD